MNTKEVVKVRMALFASRYARVCDVIGLRFDLSAINPRSVVAHGLVTAYYLKVLKEIPKSIWDVDYFGVLHKAEEKWLSGYRVEDLYRACLNESKDGNIYYPCHLCSDRCRDASLLDLEFFFHLSQLQNLL